MSPRFTREIVVLSQALLAMDSLKKYGLIDGGPGVNVERCEDAIAWGEKQGFEITQEEINATAQRFWVQWNAEKASA